MMALKVLYSKMTMTGSLPKTIKVYLTDANHNLDYNNMRLYFIDAAIWATKYCNSFKHFDILEVSDVSTAYDQICEYEFTDERDVFMFKLRWQ